MTKRLLLNTVFTGRYLDEGENIGHEVINLFKDDDGKSNLFITKNGKVKLDGIEYILFVRPVYDKITFEVVGLANDFETISNDDIDKITYAGCFLKQIFSSNTYHGKKDEINPVTCQAKNFYTPSKRIFITVDENLKFDDSDGSKLIRLKRKNKKDVLVPSAMRRYYLEDSEEYKTLLAELIDNLDNSEIWNDNNVTKLIPDGIAHNQSPSFLEVIRKEDDENIFSNLLSYFFEYSYSSFQKFAKDILKINDMGASFELVREKAVEKKS